MRNTIVMRYRLTKLLHEGRLDGWRPVMGYLYEVELDPGEPRSITRARVSLQVREYDLLDVGAGFANAARDDATRRRLWYFLGQRLPSLISELAAEAGATVVMTAAEAAALQEIDPTRVNCEPAWVEVTSTTTTRPRVFISCGQRHPEESALGDAIATMVREKTGWDAYFAQNQGSVSGVTESILRSIHEARAFIAVMHRRDPLPDDQFRASVWIEQEIAIVAFIRQVLGKGVEARAYAQRGIALEGLRGFILLNATTFETTEEVLEDLRTWLTSLAEPR